MLKSNTKWTCGLSPGGIRIRRSIGLLVVKLVNSRFSVKYVLKKESGEAIEKDAQCTDTCIHVYMLLSMEIHIAHTHIHTYVCVHNTI